MGAAAAAGLQPHSHHAAAGGQAMLSAHHPSYAALPLSSLLGMKSFPYLALAAGPPAGPGSAAAMAAAVAGMGGPTMVSAGGGGGVAQPAMVPVTSHAHAAAAAAALASYTAKISSANGMKKPERQKFAPY